MVFLMVQSTMSPACSLVQIICFTWSDVNMVGLSYLIEIAWDEAVTNILEAADEQSVSKEGRRTVFYSSGKGQTSTVTEEYAPLS